MLNKLTPNNLSRMLLSLSKSGGNIIPCWFLSFLQDSSIQWWKYQCPYVETTINHFYCGKFGPPSLLIVFERISNMGWTFFDYVTVWKRSNTFLKYMNNRTGRRHIYFVIMPKMEYCFYCKTRNTLQYSFWFSSLTSGFIYPYIKSFLTIPLILASQWDGTVYEERHHTWNCP